jgi:hypothetical protein
MVALSRSLPRFLACALALVSCARSGSATVEAIRNGSFSSGLAGWQTATDVSDWPSLQGEDGNTFVSLHPGRAFRGPLVYQNLNITGIAGAEVTVSARLIPLYGYMRCGRSVAGYLEYLTGSGEARELRLFNPADCDVFGTGVLQSATVTLPPDAARITRFSLARVDQWGQMGADDVSVRVPASATVGPVPEVTALSSSSGSYGQQLVILGTGFGTNSSGQGRVTIGGANAGVVNSWTDTQVTVTLAPPATSGPVRVIADGVESDGTFLFEVTSPHFALDIPRGPERVISGQKARFPIGVRFNNGFSTASGVTFALTGGPAVPFSFAPASVTGHGGTLLTIDTAGLAQGDYSWTVTASEPSAATVSRTVRLHVSQVGQIVFFSEDTGGNYGPVTGITRTRQGAFIVSAELKDIYGQEIRPNDFNAPDAVSWSSSNPDVTLAFRTFSNWWYFIANENGTATLTATTPDGFSASLPLTVNFPAVPSFTLLTLNPSSADNSGSSTVTIAAEATGFANDFAIVFPGPVSGSYSNGGLRYDGTGTVSANRSPGDQLVSVGNLWGGAGRAAILTVTNDPATGIVKGFISGLQPPDRSNPQGSSGSVHLYDAATGTEIRSASTWSLDGGSAPAAFVLAGVPPGTYKLRLEPPGPPEPPDYHQPQWYPNASDISQAAVITVSAGQTLENINVFYTKPPLPNPVVVSTQPADGQTDVPLDSSVSVEFDREMEDLSLSVYSTKSFVVRDSEGNQIQGQYDLLDSGHRAVFTPLEPFQSDSTYTASVTRFAYSVEGLHLLSDFTWTFTTGTRVSRPQISAVYPAPGSTDASANTFVMVMFDREIDPASVNGASLTLRDEYGNPIDGDVFLDGRVIYFVPSSWLSSTGHTAIVSGSVRDFTGEAMGADYSWSFTPLPDPVPPRVVFTIPGDGETDADPSGLVRAYLDQRMDAWSINDATFLLQESGMNSIEGLVSSDGATAYFAPDHLQPDTVYTARLTRGITNTLGQNLLEDYTWTFTTGAEGLVVLGTSPGNGDTQVSLTATLYALFDAEIDPASVTPANFVVRDGEGNRVPGERVVSGQAVVFTPDSPLLPGTTYTVTLTGARSVAGARLRAPVRWSFTTGDRLRVLSTLPWAGNAFYPRTRAVQADFDQDLDPATVNASTFLLKDSANNPVSGTVSTSGRRALFVPASPLAPGTAYTATVTTGVQGVNGEALEADYSWSFTTAVNADDRLGAIRALPDGSRVAFAGKAVHYGFAGRGYIEELDRSSGIRCDAELGDSVGRPVEIWGTLMTDSTGERYVLPVFIMVYFAPITPVDPVLATNATARGRMLDGMRVRVWGTVQSVTDGNTIVISDGSDESGLVVRNESAPISAPAGAFVVVTGAAGWNGSRIIYATEVTQLAP